MPPTSVALVTPPPPGLAEATKHSTVVWQQHLDELFRAAKDRFPDVVWELTAEDDEDKVVDEVWGHKAIVYARAPPSFQSRYFSFKPNPMSSSTPYSESPTGYPTQSALSLGLALDVPHSTLSRTPSPSPSPFRPPSPSATNPNSALLRISTCINPILFSNELEYLYTGQGFGEAFEFLFDSSGSHDQDVDGETLRIDKLRKDLVFMWRSRLYSDVRISLSGNFSSSNHENTTAIFSSHRFILASRCPYFYDSLISWPLKSIPGEPPTLSLPSPPFTPASLHFTLGFIYTGTLVFSHRTYDLSTAFTILKAALYLSLPTLHDEIQARIAHEMLHGLFHAFLPFNEYESLTGGRWGIGGCRCRQCARRAPRVLEFSLEEDVKNIHLERGARRALVGLFGEGWCTQEFASLAPKLRETLLKGVGKRTTPQNAFPLLFSAEHALLKLSSNIDPWADTVREMILGARRVIDEVICKESEASFSSEQWMEIMENDGARFEDGERVDWAMAAVLRGVKDPWAANLYQTLVSSILLRPHPTELNSPFLSTTSQIRQQIEQTRIELLKWVGKRWIQIRQEHGFDSLEGWAIKEISDHIEVPIEDLLNPATQGPAARGSPRNKLPSTLLRPHSNHPHTSRIDADSEAASSMRVSVLSRNLPSRRGTASIKDNASVHSLASSVRSSAASAMTTSSAASDSTVGRSSSKAAEVTHTGVSPARRIVQATRARDAAAAAAVATKDRPDSKLSPASPPPISPQDSTSPGRQPSINLPLEDDDDDQRSVMSETTSRDDEEDRESIANSETAEPDSTPSPTRRPVRKTVITRASLASVASRVSNSPSANTNVRPKHSSASIRSQASTSRKTTTNTASAAVTGRSKTSISTTSPGPRPISRGSSRQTTTSSISRSNTTTSTSTTRSTVTASSSRPVSRASTTSSTNNRVSTVTADSTATYRTASSGLSTPQPRSRKSSAASTTSVRTAGPGPSSPISPRTRKHSGASVSSVNSNASSSAYGTAKTSSSKVPPVPAIDPTKLSPATAKVKPKISLRSVKSVSSISNNKKATAAAGGTKQDGSSRKTSPVSSTPVSPAAPKSPLLPAPLAADDDDNVKQVADEEIQNTSSTMTIRPRNRQQGNVTTTRVEKDTNVNSDATATAPDNNNANNANANEHKKTASTTSTGSNATIRKRRSNETITAEIGGGSGGGPSRSSGSSLDKARLLHKPQPPLPAEMADEKEQERGGKEVVVGDGASIGLLPLPRGATLEIGIPCIVSSKRKRFKAYARYIGEVEGELGPWVGVEVPIPIGESGADGWQGTQWNDGTWGGIRYFEIGNRGSDWDYSFEDRATRRRRVDGGMSGSSVLMWSSKDKGGLKREGDQLMIGTERIKRFRSVSPAVSDASEAESRGLFVRPQQVLYVVDAVEDL